MHTKQAAYRTYVVGFEVPKGSFPSVLLWDMAEPYHYVRRVRGGARDVVIVGGEDHKTGQADDAVERYQRLERGRARGSPGSGQRVPLVGPAHGAGRRAGIHRAQSLRR